MASINILQKFLAAHKSELFDPVNLQKIQTGFSRQALTIKVDSNATTKKRKLKSPDTWLNQFATHFTWPPSFGDQAAESQCMTTAELHGSDLYCNTTMFRAARRLQLTDGLRRMFAAAQL